MEYLNKVKETIIKERIKQCLSFEDVSYTISKNLPNYINFDDEKHYQKEALVYLKLDVKNSSKLMFRVKFTLRVFVNPEIKKKSGIIRLIKQEFEDFFCEELSIINRRGHEEDGYTDEYNILSSLVSFNNVYRLYEDLLIKNSPYSEFKYTGVANFNLHKIIENE